jgi:hypothetical protein
MAAEVRDRGATDDPDGPKGAGTAYWPEVARMLRDSYRSLSVSLAIEETAAAPADRAEEAAPQAVESAV